MNSSFRGRVFASFHATVALSLLLAASAGTAHAQDPVPVQRFSANRFAPAPGPGNYLQVDGAHLLGHLSPGAGLTIDYAHEPLVLYDASCTDATETNCDVEGTHTEFVSYMLQFNLYGSLVLWDRVQIGLNLPLLLSNGDDFNETVRGMPVSVPGGSRFAVGDPSLSAKVRLYGDGEGIAVAASVYGTFPVANAMQGEGFLGDESLRVGGHLIAEFIQSGFHLAFNVGGFYRPERTFLSNRAGSQITYRMGVGYDVTPLVFLFGEVDGASGLSSDVDEHPLEGRLGARLRQGDLTFTLAGGAGIVSGVGTPVFRVIGGLAYAPQRGDRDGDHIDDSDDACPTDAEDMDGWEDEDGCPEADNDNDGILDADDPCPTEAEDMDGFEDEDGCPDTDNDGDGVRDGFDSCPNEAEDMDGDRDEDGCPDDDTDRDGIDDANDACPNEPEDIDGFGDEDGCPEDDFDGDGIPDDADECPDQPELINGINDTDGCPEEDADGDGVPDDVDRCPNEPETLNGRADDDGCPDGETLVEQREGRIVLLHQIQFANNRARIRGARSQQILAAVAAIMSRNPQYRKVRIEGHTDSAGREDRNVRLSQERAEAVLAALVRIGVAAERMEAVGHGPHRPIADNGTPEGRAANRRVEFHIEGGPASGQQITTEQGVAHPPAEAPAE